MLLRHFIFDDRSRLFLICGFSGLVRSVYCQVFHNSVSIKTLNSIVFEHNSANMSRILAVFFINYSYSMVEFYE